MVNVGLDKEIEEEEEEEEDEEEEDDLGVGAECCEEPEGGITRG